MTPRGRASSHLVGQPSATRARCVGRIGRYQAPAAYGLRVLIRSASAVAILGIHALDAIFGIPSARCTAECSDKTLNPGSAKRSRCGCSPTGVSMRMVCYEYAMRGGGRGKLKAGARGRLLWRERHWGEGARSHARKGIKNPAPLINQCDL